MEGFELYGQRHVVRHRKFWRSRLILMVVVVFGTLAASYRIARVQINRSYEDMNSGSELLQRNEYMASITMFDRALDRNKTLTLAWTGKGLSFLYLGRYSEALSQYEKALAIDPTLSVAWYGRGISLVNLGRHSDALSCFERVLKLYPEDMYAAGLRDRVLQLMQEKTRKKPVA